MKSFHFLKHFFLLALDIFYFFHNSKKCFFLVLIKIFHLLVLLNLLLFHHFLFGFPMHLRQLITCLFIAAPVDFRIIITFFIFTLRAYFPFIIFIQIIYLLYIIILLLFINPTHNLYFLNRLSILL